MYTILGKFVLVSGLFARGQPQTTSVRVREPKLVIKINTCFVLYFLKLSASICAQTRFIEASSLQVEPQTAETHQNKSTSSKIGWWSTSHEAYHAAFPLGALSPGTLVPRLSPPCLYPGFPGLPSLPFWTIARCHSVSHSIAINLKRSYG